MYFSILIPAYNCEKFIDQCINSIKQQTFNDWECIIIDDGSSDDTFNHILKLTKSDSRFKVYSQSNNGVSYTRNALLYKASGLYVIWVDADDYLNQYMLEKLYFYLNNGLYDGCFFNYYVVYGDIKRTYYIFESNKVVSDKVIMKHLAKEYKLKSFLWNKVIKREKYQKIFFDSKLRMLEDYMVLPLLVNRCRTICCCCECLYYYRQHVGSITHNIDENTMRINDSIIKQRQKFIRDNYEEFDKYLKIGRAFVAFENLNYSIKYYLKLSEKYILYNLFNLKKGFIYLMFERDLNYGLKVRILILCLNLKIYKFLVKIVNLFR